MFVYEIKCKESGRTYYGITNNYNKRMREHFNCDRPYPIYNAIKKYGKEAFVCRVLLIAPSREYAGEIETKLIANDSNCYNIASGGDAVFTIQDEKQWKERLSAARQGRQPFLDHTHTEETKKKCAEAGRKYRVYANDITEVPFKTANKLYGISRTHYYRLKRAASNERS